MFDFDGVLAQTMEDNYKAWLKSLKKYNISISAQEYFPYEGMKLEKLAKKYCQKAGLDKSLVEDIIKNKEDLYLKNNKFQLYRGVKSIINLLHAKNIPFAIVTAGLYNRLHSTLPENFLKKFKVIITGDQVKRGKPFPDPYLKAAKLLSVDIKKCLVIENAPLGIKSAKKAGAYCIAVSSTMGQEFLTEADEIITSINQLRGVAVFDKLFNNSI